jgi:hypothetical protein
MSAVADGHVIGADERHAREEADAMATNKPVRPSPPRPNRGPKDGPDAAPPRESPQAFYERLTKRPDIREILKRLAR